MVTYSAKVSYIKDGLVCEDGATGIWTGSWPEMAGSFEKDDNALIRKKGKPRPLLSHL